MGMSMQGLDDLSDNDDDDDIKLELQSGGNQHNVHGHLLKNVKDKLVKNGCKYIKKTAPKDINERGPRFLMKIFNEFCENLEVESYPRKHRFCLLYDRRQKEETILMFEPGKKCNVMPKQHVSDWYFNAGKECVIPCYKNSENVSGDTMSVDKACGGETITISFHVESSSCIRMYLFWNGVYIRIVYPNDLKTILPTMFDEKYGKNENYLKSEKFELDLKNIKVKDDDFTAFYNSVTIHNQ